MLSPADTDFTLAMRFNATTRSPRILGRLFVRLYRSLPMYLAEAEPWTHPGDEQAERVFAAIVADARFFCQRIAQRILQLRGRLDLGEFPMEFTDLNLLSLDYLLTELVRWQKADILAMEKLSAELADGSEDRALADEVLGNWRGHLQSLEELLRRPDPPPQIAAACGRDISPCPSSTRTRISIRASSTPIGRR